MVPAVPVQERPPTTGTLVGPMAAITSTVTELDDNKVRLHVEVAEGEFEKAIDGAFRKLADEVKIDGFRKGKVPRKLLEARIGTGAARDQALRDALPDYYAQAVVENDLDTIAAPEIDITAGEDAGAVEFEAVVELRPRVELSGYDGLRVELDVPAVDEETVDRQVEALRDRFADLEDSETPLTDGDYAEIDIKGSVAGEDIGGLSATDYLYEVGSALVVPELDTALHGARPGAILEFTATIPETAATHAGADADFRVLVKDTKRKVLPEVTDEWVSEASEFDTVEALRSDIGRRVEVMTKLQAQMALRDRVLDVVSELVTIDIPDALVGRELEHRVGDIAQRLGAQGVTIEQYLEATGTDREAFVADLREGAEKAARADLALRAVVDAEAIEASEEELVAELDRLAQQSEQDVDSLRAELDRRGVLEAVRSDIARGKALAFLTDHAEVVDTDGNPVDLSMPELSATDEPGAGDDTSTENTGETPTPAENTGESEDTE